MSAKIGVKLSTGIVVSQEMEKFLRAYSTITTQFFFDLDSKSVKTDELNFLDIEDQKITYIDTQKYRGIASIEAYSPQFKSKRIQISPSRIFSKLFDQKMVERHISGSDLEYFTHLVKAYFGPPLTLEVVTGEDIKKYYSVRTYSKGNGSLNKSCMRYDENQEYFGIYMDNAKMLVGFDGSGNVSARALLWDEVGMIKDDNGPIQFIKLMDRIYTNIDKDVVQLKDWAKDNGYAYKYEQNHNEKETIVINDKIVKARLFVTIPNLYSNYSLFPYMDTFSYGFNELDILTNKTFRLDSGRVVKYSYVGPHNNFHDTHGKYVQYLEEWHSKRPDHMKYMPMQYFNPDYNMYLQWLNSTFGTNFKEVKYQERFDEIRNENTNMYQRMREHLESMTQQAQERQEVIVTAVQRPDEPQTMIDLFQRFVRESDNVYNNRAVDRLTENVMDGIQHISSFHGLSGRQQYVDSGSEIIQSLMEEVPEMQMMEEVVPDPPYVSRLIMDPNTPMSRVIMEEVPEMQMVEEVAPMQMGEMGESLTQVNDRRYSQGRMSQLIEEYSMMIDRLDPITN